MCVVSMVSDHFYPHFPPYPPPPYVTPNTIPQVYPDLSKLERLINDFKEAMEAAKIVDRLTGQPDCVDPEKAKLEDRVAALEKFIEDRKNESIG